MTRTQDEVLARIEAVKDDDWMGFRRQVLIGALDFDHAKPYLAEHVTAEQWQGEHQFRDEGQIQYAARDYYEFALTKIEGHRGISANRSVEKLTEYAWLLGRDDAIAAMEAAPYDQYGAPQVKAFGAAFGLSWPDDEALRRMADSEPCTSDCAEGCSR